MKPGRNRQKFVDSFAAAGSIDFRRPQDQEVVPLQFPQSLLRRELRFPVRATPFYGTARTHINKSPASQRARGVGETHCSTEIHIPISLRVIGVSNSGKMDHEVERETYFWKSERVSLKIKPNRTHLRIGNIEGAMMDRGPKPTSPEDPQGKASSSSTR